MINPADLEYHAESSDDLTSTARQARRRKCHCGSDRKYKPGDRISILDFCLLCWGTGWRKS